MKKAGCTRIYFGIESGNDQVLKLMNKKITSAQARRAVEAAHQAGLEVGAFFILFYPGETDETVLSTLRFAASLPLDYLGLSMPYPLPGTALYERVRDQITREWRSGESLFGSHVLTYNSEFSEAKMWLGIIKGHAQFKIKRRLGKLAPLFLTFFEKPTDALLRLDEIKPASGNRERDFTGRKPGIYGRITSSPQRLAWFVRCGGAASLHRTPSCTGR